MVFHDGFRSFREYLGFMQAPAFRNVVFDYHRYQCFERSDIDMDIHGHIRKAAVDWREEADAINAELSLPAVCSEWSLGLDLKVVSLWAEGRSTTPSSITDDFQQDVASRAWRQPADDLRAPGGLVLLELQDRDHAGLVLPRVRGARLAALTLRVGTGLSGRAACGSAAARLRAALQQQPALEEMVLACAPADHQQGRAGSSWCSSSRESTSSLGASASVASSMKIHPGWCRNTRDAQALLDAQRQLAAPVLLGVELGPARRCRRIQRTLEHGVGVAVGVVGIAQHHAQAARGQEGLARHEHQVAPGGRPHLPAAPRPQPGHRLEQAHTVTAGSPQISTRSPRRTRRSKSSRRISPAGVCRRSRSLELGVGRGCTRDALAAAAAGWRARARACPRTGWRRGRSRARQRASSPRLSIGQDSAVVRRWKACAACISTPSVIAPGDVLRRAIRMGNTGSRVP